MTSFEPVGAAHRTFDPVPRGATKGKHEAKSCDSVPYRASLSSGAFTLAPRRESHASAGSSGMDTFTLAQTLSFSRCERSSEGRPVQFSVALNWTVSYIDWPGSA